MAKEAPPKWGEKIFHATLTVGDAVLMAADPLPQQYEQPKGFSVLLAIDDPLDTERIFHGLAENGTVQMPIQKTFWSLRFGALIDQFGILFELRRRSGSLLSRCPGHQCIAPSGLHEDNTGTAVRDHERDCRRPNRQGARAVGFHRICPGERHRLHLHRGCIRTRVR